MSELALGILRIAFLISLWLAVAAIIMVLKRDLGAPREARPMGDRPTLPPTTMPPPPTPPRKQKRRATRLAVTEGPHAGTTIPLDGTPVTIGRAPTSTLVLDDDYASSRHARIFLSGEQWVIEDLSSTNGTWMGRVRLKEPTRLDIDAPVRIGRSTLVLQK